MTSAALDNPTVNDNLSQMNGPMSCLLADESLGGNAGHVTLGGRGCSCAAAHGYADPRSGRIVAFGNFQDVPEELRAENAEFTFKVAFGGLRFIKIVKLFAKNERGSIPLSAEARQVLDESVRRWNDTREEAHHV